MTRIIDLTGQQFGRLRVVRRAEAKREFWGQAAWECECNCGKTCVVTGRELRKGHTKSCGCYSRDRAREAGRKHGAFTGGKPTLAWRIWQEMKQRCYNPKCNRYYTHGARGIKVCQRWLHSFEDFMKDMGPRPKGGCLERKDNDGDYTPENCRWATRKEQARNKRNTFWVEYQGERLSLAEWCERLGLKYHTTAERLRRGMAPEEAFAHPRRARKKR